MVVSYRNGDKIYLYFQMLLNLSFVQKLQKQVVGDLYGFL